MVILFHLLVDGGKIPPYLCRWNFPPLADGGIFPPACIWWKKFHLTCWNFSTICKQVGKFHQERWMWHGGIFPPLY